VSPVKLIEDQFSVEWVDRGRPPRAASNPAFPDGVDVDLRADPDHPACLAELPYPTGHTNIGGWLVKCRECGVTAMITAASRPDDPRSAMIPCKRVTIQ
jgi:hypothetical protein